MHVVVEMDLKLKSVQYVVFDEADRYIEGFIAMNMICLEYELMFSSPVRMYRKSYCTTLALMVVVVELVGVSKMVKF